MDLSAGVEFTVKGTNLIYKHKFSGEMKTYITGGYSQMFAAAKEAEDSEDGELRVLQEEGPPNEGEAKTDKVVGAKPAKAEACPVRFGSANTHAYKL